MEQNLENKIYIPAEFENTIFDSLPLTNGLLSFLRKNRIHFLKDLKHLTSDTVKLIVNSSEKPFPELRRFITNIQRSRSDQVILEQKIIGELTLSQLINFINGFLEQIPHIEKEILLGRLGGLNVEEVLNFEEIAKKYKTTKENASYEYGKVITQLKSIIGQSADDLTKRLKEDCLTNTSPLTPQFLVYLTNNDYNLFLYPPAFYIRLIGKLSPDIPVLPEFESKTSSLKEDAAKVAKQIEALLKESSLPLSLNEIFNKLTSLSVFKNDSDQIFFEAIQFVSFNLIKTNDPKELYIELSGTGLRL